MGPVTKPGTSFLPHTMNTMTLQSLQTAGFIQLGPPIAISHRVLTACAAPLPPQQWRPQTGCPALKCVEAFPPLPSQHRRLRAACSAPSFEPRRRAISHLREQPPLWRPQTLSVPKQSPKPRSPSRHAAVDGEMLSKGDIVAFNATTGVYGPKG